MPPPTPFDPRILLKKPPGPDPWARAEAWRYTGQFSRYNRFKGMFPGFGIAAVAFAGFCAYEALVLGDGPDGHGHGEVKEG